MIYLGTDHRGFELKEKIKLWLKEWNYDFEDCGALEYDPKDDYPDFVHRVGKKVSADPDNSFGIVLGHTGQGEAIVANKYKHVRAALYYGKLLDMIKLAKEHNHTNVLSLSATYITEGEAKEAIKLWLETKFTFEERHVRRIKEIEQIEETGKVIHG
ncbi:MAG: RpiB/LacA/LacB family sugar-phosphate isomerase [Patescibacteria group bacterium]